MKRIQIVEDLFRKAERKGYASINKNELKTHEIFFDADFLTLKHYETTILVYDLSKREVVYVYGQSNSDRDAINTIFFLINDTSYKAYNGSKKGFSLTREGSLYYENKIEV